MLIRKAADVELPKIADLHTESWRNAYSDILPVSFLDNYLEETLKHHWQEVEIRNEDVVLVAEKDELVGFVAVWCRPIPFIDNLHVKPNHRSKGVGSALLKAMAENLIKEGLNSGYLWVFENNRDAVRFYEKHGGVQKEKKIKRVFGFEIMQRKIEWSNLSKILSET